MGRRPIAVYRVLDEDELLGEQAGESVADVRDRTTPARDGGAALRSERSRHFSADRVPTVEAFDAPADREAAERALRYMGLEGGLPIEEIRLDRVFIGSCTNSRIEDLRVAAAVVRGRHVHPSVRAQVVPGSAQVKLQAEAEGLDRVFTDAGFEWRRAGCSMCLGMNPDVLAPGERCASTSNRNFEGRQGAGGRTHLVSPSVAAATAIAGRFADARDLGPA